MKKILCLTFLLTLWAFPQALMIQNVLAQPQQLPKAKINKSPSMNAKQYLENIKQSFMNYNYEKMLALSEEALKKAANGEIDTKHIKAFERFNKLARKRLNLE